MAAYLRELERTDGVKITAEQLSRSKPALFDAGIVQLVEQYAGKRGLRCRRITSGAGQDAQNMASLCPTAMIFSPSVNGVSHSPSEYTKDQDLIHGAQVLMDVLGALAGAEH